MSQVKIVQILNTMVEKVKEFNVNGDVTGSKQSRTVGQHFAHSAS